METFFVYGLVILFFLFALWFVFFIVSSHTDKEAAQGTEAKIAAKRFTMTDERVAYAMLALFLLFIVIITIMDEKKRSERSRECVGAHR